MSMLFFPRAAPNFFLSAFLIFIIYLFMYKLCLLIVLVKLHYLISGLVIISLVIMLCD